MRSLLFWGLFPFVLPQAIHLRKNAPRFSGADGACEGAVGRGPTRHLVAVGDSIIAGVGAAKLSNALVGQTAQYLAEALDARVHWVARGSIGANAKKVIQRIVPRLPDNKADFIVLSVGVNDVTSLSSLWKWRQNLCGLLNALNNHSPEAIIAVAGIPPLNGFPLLPQPLRFLFGMRGRAFDGVAKQVVSQYANAIHVPLDFEPTPEKFAPDGFHPSENSYRDFGKMVADRIAYRYNNK